MSYNEIKFNNGSFKRSWRDENGKPHREDGPAIIWYRPDGSILEEDFYLNGKYLGQNKKGFWVLWDGLNEDERKNPEILKYMAKFSMDYEEIRYSDGSFRRVWVNVSHQYHREDGPAIISYRPDDSIKEEFFYLNEKFLGKDENGFWVLWGRLTDEQRQKPEFLKYLVRFS